MKKETVRIHRDLTHSNYYSWLGKRLRKNRSKVSKESFLRIPCEEHTAAYLKSGGFPAQSASSEYYLSAVYEKFRADHLLPFRCKLLDEDVELVKAGRVHIIRDGDNASHFVDYLSITGGRHRPVGVCMSDYLRLLGMNSQQTVNGGVLNALTVLHTYFCSFKRLTHLVKMRIKGDGWERFSFTIVEAWDEHESWNEALMGVGGNTINVDHTALFKTKGSSVVAVRRRVNMLSVTTGDVKHTVVGSTYLDGNLARSIAMKLEGIGK